MSRNELKVGDDVEVLDAGLAMLRQVAPEMPPNHHGRIQKIDLADEASKASA